MRGLPLLLIATLSATAWSATVYKWVDDAGVVHFSDQPNPKAEKIQIQGAQTYGAQAAAPAAANPAAPPNAAAMPQVCAIDTPSSGQVFLDTNDVPGHVTLAHTDAEGTTVSLRMDGTDISALLVGNGSFQLLQMERGDHTLTVQVTNARGEVTCEAHPVTFTIRQPTAGASRANGVPTAPTVPGAPRAPTAPGVGGR